MEIPPHPIITSKIYLYKINIRVTDEVECLGTWKNLPAFLVFCGDPQGPVLFQKSPAHNYSFPVKNSSLLHIGVFFIFFGITLVYGKTKLEQKEKEKECTWSD